MVRGKLRGFLLLVAGLFLIRLALVLPGDSDYPQPDPVFWDLDQQPIEADLPDIANLIFYFVPSDACEKHLEEVAFYTRLTKAYPEVSTAVIFRDPQGSFSQDRPRIAAWMEESFGYTGLILLDRKDIIPMKYHVARDTKIFYFNHQRQLESVWLPGPDNQKQRFIDYFDLIRNYTDRPLLP